MHQDACLFMGASGRARLLGHFAPTDTFRWPIAPDAQSGDMPTILWPVVHVPVCSTMGSICWRPSMVTIWAVLRNEPMNASSRPANFCPNRAATVEQTATHIPNQQWAQIQVVEWYTFCLIKAKVKDDTELSVRSNAFRSWIELGGQVAYQSIRNSVA